MAKPSLPQGTRDFGPDVVRKRNYIFDTIRNVFELYGFQPLETPAMENLDTLMGKYGEEGDKLIFRILDSGNPFNDNFLKAFGKFLQQHHELYKYVAKQNNEPNIKSPYELPFWQIPLDELVRLSKALIEDKEYARYLPELKNESSSKALKYDLTIPFARYVAMNHNQLTFPFKRYQIQPVWRADRPQKGRYREFYQCDADVVGSNSLLNEVELVNIYASVFEKLRIDVEIKINSRKLLTALAEIAGGSNKMMDITIAIDKLDKIGLEKVKEELYQRNLNQEQIDTVSKYLLIAKYSGDNKVVIDELKKLLGGTKSGADGLNELQSILEHITDLAFTSKVLIDPTLARGLNYYTGTIFEINALNVKMGSIGGGGRYDDLTSLFGVPNIPGVGISFGVDRIYDVMEELKLFPIGAFKKKPLLFFNLGEIEGKVAFTLMQRLREKDIYCELYHEPAKFEKQFKYADKKNVQYIVIIGEEEIKTKTCKIKNLHTGEQQTISQTELLNYSFS